MDYLLLSRLTKDFLNQDPALVPGKQLFRMGWSGSVLVSSPIPMGPPRLAKPRQLPPASLAPPRVFSRGALDASPKTNPEPIRELLTETNEFAKARPVPGKIPMLRSICRGKGILRQNSKGLVFLDIDERFVAMLQPYLRAHGLSEPPYLSFLGSSIHAHIPVISAREAAFHYLGAIDLVQKEFSFEIEGLYSVTPTNWPEIEQVWFFKVHSPDLEKFRGSQFLPSIPNGHSFHIAVAIRPKSKVHETPKTLPSMRINPAISAA